MTAAPAAVASPDGLVEVEGTLLRHRVTRGTWGTAQLHVDRGAEGAAVGTELTIVGPTVAAVSPGASLRVEGRVERHPTWGPQLKVVRLENLGIRSAWAAANWLTRLDGIGRVLADRLAAAFPAERILEVLQTAPPDGQPDPLMTVEGISAGRARSIRESWEAVRLTLNPEDLHYLEGTCQLTRWEAQSVLSLAARVGATAQALLEREPYRLVELKGWGFVRADRVALKAGMGRDAPARVEAATVHVLAERCEEAGHTAVPLAEIVDRTVALLEVPEPKVRDAVRALSAKDQLVQLEEGGRKLVCLPELHEAEQRVLRGVLRGRGR